MKNLVHFLVRHPEELNAYLFPTELRDRSHVGFGGFFTLGEDSSAPPNESYLFYAVNDEQLVAVELQRSRGRKTVFQANVDGIGVFQFRATQVRNPGKYVGEVAEASGFGVIHRFKPKVPALLDAAARRHNFYFVGYSPRVQ